MRAIRKTDLPEQRHPLLEKGPLLLGVARDPERHVGSIVAVLRRGAFVLASAHHSRTRSRERMACPTIPLNPVTTPRSASASGSTATSAPPTAPPSRFGGARRSRRRTLRPSGRVPGSSGPEARGPPAALRLPPRAGRGAPLLGGPQGALARPGREAPGGGGRGPPGRVRRLRGGDPRGQLRRRRGDRLGPGAVGARSRTPTRAAEGQARSSSCGATSCAGAGRSSAPRRRARRPAKEWLLIKKPDAWARAEAPRPCPQESILSGLTVEELRDGRRARRPSCAPSSSALEAPRREVARRRT